MTNSLPLYQTVAIFLGVLGVLVFVHELGHFLAARRVGIRVLTFSLGFGKKLVSFKRGDTEYCISVLPLGGYVKMAGEAGEEPRTGAPDEFLSKTKWQRFQVLIMGPIMNLMLAVVLTAVVLTQVSQEAVFLTEAPVVGVVTANSPAEQAGLLPGDRLVQVGGSDIKDWRDVALQIGTKAPGNRVEIVYERNGERRSTRVQTQKEEGVEGSTIGVKPDTYPLIKSTVAGGVAEKAGVKADDVVLAIDGQRMVYASDLRAVVSKKPDVEIELTIRRDGAEQHIRLTPIREGDEGRIGVYPTEMMRPVDLNPLEAVGQSVKENYEASGLIFSMIGGLFTGENSLRQLQGPVAIAQMSGEAAKFGWLSIFQFMAMLSLNLGLLNLLPIPILDGGHILIMLLEGVARRDFSMQMKERMLMAGFVLLMMLMVTVFYNDLSGIGIFRNILNWRQ